MVRLGSYMSPGVEGMYEPTSLRETLVNKLLAAEIITQPAVAEAFRALPRHIFLPGVEVTRAYEDIAIVTKEIYGVPVSSSSQPAMMAIMLEQLDLQPGQRVLEIGAGTGFNAALMAHLVGDPSLVTTVDIDEDLVTQARANLAVAGFGGVNAVCADGGQGYQPNAPYDRIILTVGAWDISPAWVEQLREGGILLLPLDFNGPQLSVAFEKRDGVLHSRYARCCGFMRLRGEHAGPDLIAPLDESGQAVISAADVERLNLKHLRALLVKEPQVDEISLAGGWLAGFSLDLWLALNGLLQGWLRLPQPAFGLEAGEYTIFEGEIGSLCLMGNGQERTKLLYTYGDPATREQLLKMMADWEAKGPLDPNHVHVTAHPANVQVKSAKEEWLIRKRWWQYVVGW
jgi:protein-L-isoaspartate(D-aspartate) O-methyltransferase